MAQNPSFEELQDLEVKVPSFEELQKEPEKVQTVEEKAPLKTEDIFPGESFKEKAWKFLQNVSAAQAAGLMPIAAQGPAGLVETPFEFATQFVKEPAEAPTLTEVMQVAGVPETEIPLPEIEPGLGMSIPTSAMAKMAEKITGKKGPEFPETMPASEAAGQAVGIATDPLNILLKGAGAIPVATELGYRAAKGTAVGTGALAGGAFGALAKTSPEGRLVSAKTMAGKTGKAITKGFEAVEQIPANIIKEYESLKPTIRSKFIEQYELANRVGINPDLIAENARLIYGPDAFVTKAKAAKTSITPELDLQKFDQLQVELSNALVNQVEKISAGKLTRPNKVAVGEAIRKSYDEAIGDLFNQANVRYSQLASEIPSGSLDKTSSTALYDILGKVQNNEEKALKYASTVASKKPHLANIEAIETIRNNIFEKVPKEETFIGKIARKIQGKPQPIENVFVGDLGQAVEQLQQIGREAYSSQNFFGISEIPASKSLLKQIYGDLRDVIVETVKKERPDLLDDLLKSNELQKKFFDKNKFIGQVIQDEKISPEDVYSRLVQTTDSKKLEALKEIIGDREAKDYIKGQVLFDAISKEGVTEAPFYNRVNKVLKTEDFNKVKNTFFDVDEVDTFKKVIELGQDIGAREFNPSRSGVLIKALQAIQKPISAIEAAVTGKATTQFLESGAYSKYFKDYDLDSLFQRRIRGGFNEQLLDEVIKEKMSDPVEMQRFAKLQKEGKITKEVQRLAEMAAEQEGPLTRYEMIKKASQYANKMMNITENIASSTYKGLQLANRINQKKYGEERNVPLFIPEEDRENVIAALKESKMNSIQKAKNIRNLSNYGYILDLRGFDGEEKDTVQKRLLQKNIIKPEQQKSLKTDRPDILKMLEKAK